MDEISIDPVTITVPVAIRASGLGRTKLYELLGRHEIESITVGRRRLINYASLQRFLSGKARGDV